MEIIDLKSKNNQIILALGAESSGNFCIFFKEKIYFSQDFGNLLEENNFNKFKKTVSTFIKNKKIKPDIILTDLHPLMKTTQWGKKLSQKYKAQHIQVQHHHAHIFSAIGEKIIQNTKYKIPNTFYGIAMDGTGYGLDEKIWGGEVFELRTVNSELRTAKIGHLENQTMIGGELAIKEPARMLVSILTKIPNFKSQVTNKFQNQKSKSQKKFIYDFVKKYYAKNEFELLYSQLEQNFNCLKTSSTGRILDAVSLLLGFCNNERKYKHEAIDLLEKNSTRPYTNLKPQVIETLATTYELKTTALFKYLIKNLHKDKKRLAATAQLYIAEGLHEIIQKDKQNTRYKIQDTFSSGGITNNKIISKYLESKNVYLNKKIPRGDAGLSFGQIFYFLFK